MCCGQLPHKSKTVNTVDITAVRSIAEFGSGLVSQIGSNVAERLRMMQENGTPLAAKMEEIRQIAAKAQSERAAMIGGGGGGRRIDLVG